MTPDERAKQIVEEAIAQDKERVQHALELGGLPSEEEAEAVAGGPLQQSFDELERFVWRIEGIASSYDGSDLPFDVGLADLGLLTTFANEVESRSEDFVALAGRIRKAINSLDGIRLEQRENRTTAA